MCGIAGFQVRGGHEIDVNSLASIMLKGIDPRGGDACGQFQVTENGTVFQKAAVRADEFNRHRIALEDESGTVMLHTRMATQGGKGWDYNNHPLEYGKWVIAHNGVLQNDDAVFETTKANRIGQVDSEAIACMLSETCDDPKGDVEGVTFSLEFIEGSMAISAVHRDHPGVLVLARASSSPLYVARIGMQGKESFSLFLYASTEYVVADAIASIYDMTATQAKTLVEKIPEGTLLLVENGAIVRRETFKPNEGKRYTRDYDHYDSQWYERYKNNTNGAPSQAADEANATPRITNSVNGVIVVDDEDDDDGLSEEWEDVLKKCDLELSKNGVWWHSSAIPGTDVKGARIISQDDAFEMISEEYRRRYPDETFRVLTDDGTEIMVESVGELDPPDETEFEDDTMEIVAVAEVPVTLDVLMEARLDYALHVGYFDADTNQPIPHDEAENFLVDAMIAMGLLHYKGTTLTPTRRGKRMMRKAIAS